MPKFDCTVRVSAKILLSIKTGNLPASIHRGMKILEMELKHDALKGLAFLVEDAYMDVPDGSTRHFSHFNLTPVEFGHQSQYHVPYCVTGAVKVQVEAADAGAAKRKAAKAVREMDIGDIATRNPTYKTISAKKVLLTILPKRS